MTGANFPTPIFNFYIFIGVSRIRSVTKFMFLLDVYIGVDIRVCKFTPLFICNNFTGSSQIYWRKQVLSSSEVLNVLVIYIVRSMLNLHHGISLEIDLVIWLVVLLYCPLFDPYVVCYVIDQYSTQDGAFMPWRDPLCLDELPQQ